MQNTSLPLRCSTVRHVLVSLLTLLSVPGWALDVALQSQAEAALWAALQSARPELQSDQIQMTWLAPRGAALQPCPAGWSVAVPRLQRLQRIPLALHCGSERGSLVAQVRVLQPVWTLRQDRPAGHVLQADDLLAATVWLDSLEPFPAAAALRGARLRLARPAGSRLASRDLSLPLMLRRNDKVEIRASVDGVTVSAQGLALKAGHLGQPVTVRNLRSGQVIDAVVIAPGVVQAGARKPGAAGGVKVRTESSD